MPVPAALSRAAFPEPVLDVLRRLADAGHRSWLVGGSIRDLLLARARATPDFDVATPARPEEVMALFPKVVPTGIEHGTVTVLARGEPVEVTTFRGEGAYLDGRHPASVTFHADLDADLARRDFTMNALAYDPLRPELRDPYGGQADLAAGLIRAVGDPAARFGEDGLRPVRAARFVAQLGFALEPATRAAIPGALAVVRKVAAERITDELGKLLTGPHAAEGLRLLRSTALLSVVLPELAARPARATLHAAAVLRAAPPEVAPRLAVLLHELPPAEADGALARLRLPRRTVDEAVALLRAYPCLRAAQGGGRRARALPAEGDAEVRRWLAAVGPERAETLLAISVAEAQALPPGPRPRAVAEVAARAARVLAVRRTAPPLAVGDLALDGRAVAATLGQPGPQVGEALRHLLDRVLEDPALNEPGALRAELDRWWAARGGRV
jgi:tRNA nucleotidyltransferase (CCA-adding enzyme)